MTTNKQLLELAAKAAGIVGSYSETHPEFGDDWVDPGVWYTDEYDCTTSWSPLDNDGDALRLAVKLQMDVLIWEEYVAVSSIDCAELDEDALGGCIYAATRRAIVRAAAEIGRSME